MRFSRVLTALLLGLTLACASGPSHKARAIPVPPPTHPVADLERALASPDAAARAAAAWELAGADTLGAETLKTLLDLSRGDPDLGVRNGAAWAFGHLASATKAGKEMAEHQYDQAPKLTSQARLVYPGPAFDKKVAGTVEVEILIEETGNVARAEVRKSIPELDAAALDNVRKWHFSPALKDGKPVPSTALAPVTFRIY